MRDADQPDGLTRLVARTADQMSTTPLDPVTQTRATLALVDWLGVTVAGSVEESAVITRALSEEEGGRPRSTVVGTAIRTSVQQAAFDNAVAAHALDFDDSSLWTMGHPTAPVMSAALAMGEASGASGEEVLRAYSNGIHAQSMIGIASGRSAYDRGFHMTGTLGGLGSAVAAGSLLGLRADRLAVAVSLAATQSAGVKAVFGSMGKHLNVGAAAANGVRAAMLADRGFTAPADALESDRGYQRTHADEEISIARISDELGGRTGLHGLRAKRHAACHGTHSAIEGVLSIRARRPFQPDEVARVRLSCSTAIGSTCNILEPRTGLEAKFSIRHASALALVGRPTTADSFTDEVTQRADVVAMRDLVTVHVEEGPARGRLTAVRVEFRDGSVEEAQVDAMSPVEDHGLELHQQEMSAKFRSLVDPLLGPTRATNALGAALDFARAESPRELMRAVALTQASLSHELAGRI